MKSHKTILRQSVLAGLVSTTVISGNAYADTDPYLEQSGRLVVEIESEPAGDSWAQRQDIYGYTGAGFLVYNGPNNFAKSEATRGEAITYSFRITNAGNYQLRWRSRNTVGDEPTDHNDSWVQFPTGQNIDDEHPLDGWTKAYMGQVNQWTWDAATVDGHNRPIRQFFEAGEHTIQIAGRSNGHGLDRFVLYRYEEEEHFDTSLYMSLATSPKASEEQLESHTYTGNSCYADTLSLAAQHSVQYSDSGSQTTLLSFDVPDLTDVELVELLVTGEDGALDQSAYLGSDSNWIEDSEPQSRPSAAALLGSYSDDETQGTIQSLEIDTQVLVGGGITTLMLITDNDDPQSPFDIGTRAESRLQIVVGETACNEYNSARISGDDPNESSSTEEPSTGETTDGELPEGGNGEEENSGEESTGEESTSEESTNGETVEEEGPGESTVGEPVSVQPPVDATVDETTDASSEESETTDASDSDTASTSDSSSSRSSGGVGYWSLALMGLVLLRRTSRKMACRT